jgi:hypothetical protein
MTSQYAAALEAKELEASKTLIEALWSAEREKQRETRLRESMNPLQFTGNLIIQGALTWYDLQRAAENKYSILKSYRDLKNINPRNNLPDAQELVDYLEYEDLLSYLQVFTENSIEASIDYGDKLARCYRNNPKTRMGGKPIPSYPPIIYPRRTKPSDTTISKDNFDEEKK